MPAPTALELASEEHPASEDDEPSPGPSSAPDIDNEAAAVGKRRGEWKAYINALTAFMASPALAQLTAENNQEFLDYGNRKLEVTS